MTKKIRAEFKRRPDRTAVLLLTALELAVVLLTIIVMHKGIVWGADTDWKSQHFAIPEYFRIRFYETHDVFPDFALQLGGGQNIYDYAYYGIANPLYLPAYALPFVRMSTYIELLMLLTVWVSAVLSYYFFKRHFRPETAFLLSVMFLCSSGLIYHSAMQIMFMNYMPFVIGMFLICGKKNSGLTFFLMALMAYCVMCMSFYFSISCFCAVGTYMIYFELTKKKKIKISEIFKNIWLKIAAAGVGVLCAAFMWLPTLSAITGGRDGTNKSIPLWQILIPSPNLFMILYSAYSMGMIGMVIIAAMYMVRKGKRHDRFLSGMMICLSCMPILNYMLNGFMYIDGKMYMPFAPVMLLVFGSFISEKFYNYKELTVTAWIFAALTVLTIILHWTSLRIVYSIVIAIGCIIEMIVFLNICRRKKGNSFKYAALALSIILCVSVNVRNKFVKAGDIDLFYDKEISQTVSDVVENDSEELYRFSNCLPNDINVNRIYSLDYLSTNSYSSLNNTNYRNFRFKSPFGENRTRNTAVQNQPYNMIFDSLMGCRYRLAPKDSERLGEEKVTEMGDNAVYRNNFAFPMGYASSRVISEEQYDALPDEQKVRAMIENIVVPQQAAEVSVGKPQEIYPELSPLYENEHISFGDGVFTIDSKKNFEIEAKLPEPLGSRFLIITCEADNRIGNIAKQNDIALTINGVKNKLTKPTWKYNNKNYEFRFIINPDEKCDTLTFKFTKGYYTISDLRFYCMDISVLEKGMDGKDTCIIDRSASLGDTIKGSINVSSDGWFNLSVPYDKGFTVLVDGGETEYFQTNKAFIGFPIKSGEHSIEVTFEAPLKTEGRIVSTAALAVLAVMVLITEANAKHRRKK